MKTTCFSILIQLFFLSRLWSQTDTVAPLHPLLLEEKINYTRLELKSAFLMEDPAATSLWLDSLGKMYNDEYVAINWDERWLLYYWSENYGAVLSESGQFGANERAIEANKVPTPNDSLFEVIDAAVFEKRFDLFQNIRHAFLNEEEKAFATLLLEYLLRMNQNEEDWADRLTAFQTKFPESQYNYFIGSVKPVIFKPLKQALGVSAQFLSGTFSDELDRSLKPLFAVQFDIYYWINRWNFNMTTIFGGPRIARDILDGDEIWPKDDPTNYFSLGLDLGYDIFNNSRIRIFPAVGAAFTVLKPPTPDEDSEEEPPPYYDNFNYIEGHLYASITADAKLFGQDYKSWEVGKGSYHGVRIKAGYNWLNFGNQNDMLSGRMFYFSVGYNLFAVREKK